MSRDRLIVALDVATPAEALALVDKLGDAAGFYKIGMQLLSAGGYMRLVDQLTERGHKVFADLKFFDVPATVAAAVRGLRYRGLDFLTVHGNQAIMEAAASSKGAHLKILAVTALTSLDRGDLNDLGFACDVEELVLSRARRALEAGCDGVIASGLELPVLRRALDSRLLVVTPGIRPVDNDEVQDQKRVMTPAAAVAAGADHIVVGRPINAAADPRAAALAIQKEISRGLDLRSRRSAPG
ncbi:orotidine-5'-phosphate decarboxylase [Candidatus Foliamicus sp.]